MDEKRYEAVALELTMIVVTRLRASSWCNFAKMLPHAAHAFRDSKQGASGGWRAKYRCHARGPRESNYVQVLAGSSVSTFLFRLRTMSRIILRSLHRIQAPSPCLFRAPPARRFLSTAPPARKSRSWKSSAVRWGLAAGAIYYYNTSTVFADNPTRKVSHAWTNDITLTLSSVRAPYP